MYDNIKPSQYENVMQGPPTKCTTDAVIKMALQLVLLVVLFRSSTFCRNRQ
jgi:hypothetical protein